MNRVKKAARRYKLGKLYGSKIGEMLGDNRTFARRDALGNRTNNLDARDALIQKLDVQKWTNRVEQIQFIHANRDKVDLRVPGGTYIGFHDDLTRLTDGEVERRYHKLREMLG